MWSLACLSSFSRSWIFLWKTNPRIAYLLLSDLHQTWVYVLSRQIRNQGGLRRVIQRAEVLFQVSVARWQARDLGLKAWSLPSECKSCHRDSTSKGRLACFLGKAQTAVRCSLSAAQSEQWWPCARRANSCWYRCSPWLANLRCQSGFASRSRPSLPAGACSPWPLSLLLLQALHRGTQRLGWR